MKRLWTAILIIFATIFCAIHTKAQNKPEIGKNIVPVCVYKGDTIPSLQIRNIYIYPEWKFKNNRERVRYNRLVRDVKKTLPIAKLVKQTIIETYELLQTLPDEQEKEKHLKAVEKGLKKQYMPMMRKMTFSQGKLLIKLIDRECDESAYGIIKAFMGPFKAGFYQAFAAMFGTSLKKEYDPEGIDEMTERIIILVENGQL